MGLGEKFIRWRHGRGFGIHSPFAYRLVKEAICPQRGYVYYAELTPRLSHPLAAVAYRVSIFLYSFGCSLKIVNPGETPPDSLGKKEAWMIVQPSPSVREALTEALESSGQGLAIDGREYLLLIPREEMAFVRYLLP